MDKKLLYIVHEKVNKKYTLQSSISRIEFLLN